jgi:hypothetical protein
MVSYDCPMFYTAIGSSAIEDWEPTGISEYTDVPKLAQGVRTGDGLLLFNWFSDTRTAMIKALGRVLQSDQPTATVSISWKEVSFEIKPGSRGFRHWRDKWIVHLEPSRVDAYDLKNRFAIAFNDDVFHKARVNSSYILRKDVAKDLESIIPEQGFVYLMFDGELWKIGKALNITSRKKQLERQLGKPLELLHAIQSDDYSRAEAEMHHQYKHCRKRGEWFKLSPDERATIHGVSQISYS